MPGNETGGESYSASCVIGLRTYCFFREHHSVALVNGGAVYCVRVYTVSPAGGAYGTAGLFFPVMLMRITLL